MHSVFASYFCLTFIVFLYVGYANTRAPTRAPRIMTTIISKNVVKNDDFFWVGCTSPLLRTPF